MKITDIRATTVAVPLEAPLRHANGAHWGKFVRTIVEVETDKGLVGLGEMGGGGESAEVAFQGLKPYLVGHDPFELEALRFKICNPNLSPPFGPACFYLKTVAPKEITLNQIFNAMWPFLGLQLIGLILVLSFPEIALWLTSFI